ncbi:MAG: hypothetical protein ACE14M_09885 [Terriglobales bacterium]
MGSISGSPASPFVGSGGDRKTVIMAQPVNSPQQGKGGQSEAQGFSRKIRDFLYGMTGYEFEQHALEMRAELETVFMAITFGDMLGLPVIPPLYSLRLLPYVVPGVTSWKKRVAREREFSDGEEFHLHGV